MGSDWHRLRPVLHFPTLAHAVQTLRSDICAHVMVENAPTMMPVHRDAILYSLGLGTDAVVQLDAKLWTEMGRGRLYISSIPYLPLTREPARRIGIWDEGWGRGPWEMVPGHGGTMPTMMQSRGGRDGAPRASTYHPGKNHYRPIFYFPN